MHFGGLIDTTFNLPPPELYENFIPLKHEIEENLIMCPHGVLTQSSIELASLHKNSHKFILGFFTVFAPADSFDNELNVGGVFYNLTEAQQYDFINQTGNVIYPVGVRGLFNVARFDKMNMFIAGATGYSIGFDAGDKIYASKLIMSKVQLWHLSKTGRPVFFNIIADLTRSDIDHIFVVRTSYFIGRDKQ